MLAARGSAAKQDKILQTLRRAEQNADVTFVESCAAAATGPAFEFLGIINYFPFQPIIQAGAHSQTF